MTCLDIASISRLVLRSFSRIYVYYRDNGNEYYNSKDSQELLINSNFSPYEDKVERRIERGLLYF